MANIWILKLLLRVGLPLCLAGGILVFCLDQGIIWFNNPPLSLYPVRGVDVSHHQGEVDWPRLAGQNIHFVFIKATEGGDFKDTRFERNWSEARAAGLKVGAYHFFRSGKSGLEQAVNFIDAVPRLDDALPPALDLELPTPNDPEARRDIIVKAAEFLDILEAHYGKKPIIYITPGAYGLIVDGFEGYPLWVRSLYTDPWTGERGWAFWQYSNHGRLEGYSGPEKRIDLNVFNSTWEDFRRFAGESVQGGS